MKYTPMTLALGSDPKYYHADDSGNVSDPKYSPITLALGSDPKYYWHLALTPNINDPKYYRV